MKELTTWLFLTVFVLFMIFILDINSKKRKELKRANAWPEVLDLVISSLQSGASITESLADLSTIGPLAIRSEFSEFKESMEKGDSFELALNQVKERFADPICDQFCEVLFFAAKFGSRNTIKVLRELSEYVAADLSTRAEINTRFGWVKNSANLAALAPWVLFLILRSQENAKLAYQQSFGKALLLSGLILTLIAYLWMNQIAKLPKAKRLFTVLIADK
jgi:tight adherence protein B